MRFCQCLSVFIVMLLSLAALAQQKSNSNSVINTPSPSPALATNLAADESAVAQSKAGSSLRPFTMFGVGGRASTLGMGVQFGTNLTPRSNLRVGFSSLRALRIRNVGIFRPRVRSLTGLQGGRDNTLANDSTARRSALDHVEVAG